METNFMEHAEMKKQLTNLEDRGRRNNLRINGIEEIEGETNESLEEDIKVLFKEKLGITKNIKIERIHRSGSKSYRDGNINIKRVIVLKCLNFKDKELVLKSYIEKKLWLDKIYVNEDFSEKTLDIRKNLFRTAKDLRAQGKYAKVSYNRLVTNKDEY